MIDCFVAWPSAPLTDGLVKKALGTNFKEFDVITDPVSQKAEKLIQWSSYDCIDHERTHSHRSQVLSSSYIIRKALIRKHYLSRTINSYVTKRPQSLLKKAIPKTFEIEITFADELDEMWLDDLWDLGQSLETDHSWWILKPGMSDRGMGIRLFNSKDTLQEIFEGFEEESEEEDNEEDTPHGNTSVVTSQLRHFVIQEYISNPLLLEVKTLDLPDVVDHKFHLRAYCVAEGALRVYLYDRILALFAPIPYTAPSLGDQGEVDLSPHLTNTCLQENPGEGVVRLLDELVGCKTRPPAGELAILTKEDVEKIKQQMSSILEETFRAALENPVHFQPLPNAFELYGVDFLVAYTPQEITPYQVKLLEMNAEPAIEQTGARLTWILEELFDSMGKVCVKPFVDTSYDKLDGWAAGATRYHFIKCLDEEFRM